MDISEQLKRAEATSKAAFEKDKKIEIEKNAPEVEEAISGVTDDSIELFKKIIAKEVKDKKEIAILMNTDNATIKSLYSNQIKSDLNEFAGKGLSKQEMLDKWHMSLAVTAKQIGAIDQYDDRTLQLMLKEKTFKPEFEKYDPIGDFTSGFKNNFQFENVFSVLIVVFIFSIGLNYLLSFKRCQSCGERVRLNAIKCKHCGEKLNIKKIKIGHILLKFVIGFVIYFTVSMIIKQLILLNNPETTGKMFIIDIFVVLIMLITTSLIKKVKINKSLLKK